MIGRAQVLLVAVALPCVAAACTRDQTSASPTTAAATSGVPSAGTSTPTSTSTIVTTSTTPSTTPTTTRTTTPTTTTIGTTTTTRATTTTTTATSTSSSTSTSTSVALPPVTLPPTTIPAPGSTGSIREVRPASDIPAPPLPVVWVVESIGTSVQGRDIESWSRRVPDARRTVVVVGAIHGNEPASPPTVRALVEVVYPDDVEVWLIPEMNPDGVAAGTRWNANGVDLNRNFPWGWRADDGGPGPLSEPETEAVATFLGWLEPDLVVWVHQPYGYTTSVGGSDDRFEQAWSAGSGLPVRPDVTQHGGGESWAHFHAGVDSMLIEIDTWAATPEIVAAQRAGFEAALAALG